MHPLIHDQVELIFAVGDLETKYYDLANEQGAKLTAIADTK